jgi:hypothetical protein
MMIQTAGVILNQNSCPHHVKVAGDIASRFFGDVISSPLK